MQVGEEVEEIEVEEDVGEETGLEMGEVEDEHWYSSSSSSKIIEDRSIGGRAALLKQRFSQEMGHVPQSTSYLFSPGRHVEDGGIL